MDELKKIEREKIEKEIGIEKERGEVSDLLAGMSWNQIRLGMVFIGIGFVALWAMNNSEVWHYWWIIFFFKPFLFWGKGWHGWGKWR